MTLIKVSTECITLQRSLANLQNTIKKNEDYELKHELFRNNDDGDYESYFNIEELDKYKIIALFSERFGWIEKFEETK